MTVWYFREDQEDPSWVTTVYDRNGAVKDLSAHTGFVLKLVNLATGATVLTKSANITGAATAPNLAAAFAVGELNILTGLGLQRVDTHPHVKGTLAGRDWVMPQPEADTIVIYAAPA